MAEDSPFLRRNRVPARPGPRGRGRPLLFGLLAAVCGLSLLRLLAGQLSLQRFDIAGNRRARTEEILSVLSGWRGANLVTLDLAPLSHRVSRHPWIQKVTLSKRFPDGLSVRVVERRAAALWRDGSRLWWLGEDGRLIARYDPRGDFSDSVLVSGDRRALAEAVGLLDDLAAARPEYFSALSEIAVLPGGGFGMMDSLFRVPVRVLRRDAPEKIRALLEARRLMESRGWEARAIDLRFADRIVLVGAYGAGSSL